MKAENYILISDQVASNAITRIMELPADGKTKVTISDTGSKTVRQRGLQWIWYTDVARSGLGDEDTKEEVHIKSKYRFARPILLRDSEEFADIWNYWISKYKDNAERMRWFIDKQIHTEQLDRQQMAEYLTEFQQYHLQRGFELTNPDDKSLLEYQR